MTEDKAVKPMFNMHSRYNRINVPSPAGKCLIATYKARLNANGDYVIIPDVPKDISKIIRSHKEECDINCIVKRYLGGDLDVLNKRVGTYADLSAAPKNLVQAYQMVSDADKRFHELPPDVRELFDNSTQKFAAAISGGTVDSILKDYIDKKLNKDVNPNPKPPTVIEKKEEGDK